MLLGVALAQGHIANAISHARTLCALNQQALAAALAAWDAGRAEDACQNLQNAVDSAQMVKFP